MITDFNANIEATAKAHEEFLALAQEMTTGFSNAFNLQNQLIASLSEFRIDADRGTQPQPNQLPAKPSLPSACSESPLFDREQCLEFATGSIGRLLGPEFDIIDTLRPECGCPMNP